MEILRELVPAGARKAIYAVYVVAGLIVGGVQASGADVAWVQPALDVLAYLAVPLALLAGVNVTEKGQAGHLQLEVQG